MILAFNRCLVIGSPRTGKLLFHKWRVYPWILFPFCHAFIAMTYSNGIMFSSIGGAWFFNPHYGYVTRGDFDVSLPSPPMCSPSIYKVSPLFQYHNPFQTVQNIGVVLLLTLVYSIFGITLTRKSCQNSQNTVASCIISQAPIFTQVGIISFINLVSALAYYFMQFFDLPVSIVKATSFSWVLIHGE